MQNVLQVDDEPACNQVQGSENVYSFLMKHLFTLIALLTNRTAFAWPLPLLDMSVTDFFLGGNNV